MGSCCGGKESKKGFCPFSLFLFAATGAAFAYHKLQQKKSRDDESSSGAATTKPQVVFVLGGPGAGKGTQCELITKRQSG